MSRKNRRAKEKCRSKQAHPTEAKAIAHKIWHEKTFGTPMKTYHCPICKKWHVAKRWERM